MGTPQEKLELAADASADPEAREDAIDGLQTANDCDALAELVQSSDLEDRYREAALANLAHPQCKPTLERLAESGDLDGSLQDRAADLLSETADDAGAGP